MHEVGLAERWDSNVKSIQEVMELLDDTGRQLYGKGKQVKEAIHVKNQIAACEDVVKKNYMDIGRLYYEAQESGEEIPSFAKQCTAIRNAQKGIADLQQQLHRIQS